MYTPRIRGSGSTGRLVLSSPFLEKGDHHPLGSYFPPHGSSCPGKHPYFSWLHGGVGWGDLHMTSYMFAPHLLYCVLSTLTYHPPPPDQFLSFCSLVLAPQSMRCWPNSCTACPVESSGCCIPNSLPLLGRHFLPTPQELKVVIFIFIYKFEKKTNSSICFCFFFPVW